MSMNFSQMLLYVVKIKRKCNSDSSICVAECSKSNKVVTPCTIYEASWNSLITNEWGRVSNLSCHYHMHQFLDDVKAVAV